MCLSIASACEKSSDAGYRNKQRSSESELRVSAMAPDTAPEFAFAIDPVVAAYGIPPLRGERGSLAHEVRVWTGFGMVSPHALLRLRKEPYSELVVGELVLWWDGPVPQGTFLGTKAQEAYSRRQDAHWTAEMRDHVRTRFGCKTIAAAPHVEACRKGFEREPDWATALARLESLGVSTLPTQSALGEFDAILDGHSVVVEVRDRSVYRTFSYHNPDLMPGPEARRVVAIDDLVDSLLSLPASTR